jgi:hypothetical protein
MLICPLFVLTVLTALFASNLQATNQLNIDTKNLEASSVQNKHKVKTRSQGASLGIGSSGVSSVGFNQSKADKNSKTVLYITPPMPRLAP